MKRNHFMSFAPQDWLSSPLRGELALERDHLTRMVYLELLLKLWEEGGAIRRSDVAGACAITKGEAEKAIVRLLESGRLYEVDGVLRNERVDKDLTDLGEYRESQSQKAKARWKDKPVECHGIATAMPDDAKPQFGNAGGVGVGVGVGEGIEVVSSVPVVIEERRGQLTLVPVEPRSQETKAREITERYLGARHMRLHGTVGNRKPPSRGMLASVTARVMKLLREGYEPDLLVSLPALVDDGTMPDGRTTVVDAMLKDPEILLRTDNAQGGKCHARRYEAKLNGQELSDRQVAILRNIGTLDYVKRSGAKARNWEAGA